MKKIIILILIIVLFSSAVNATFIDEATTKIICSKAEACKIYQWIVSPEGSAKNILFSKIPQPVQQAISTSKDPTGTAYNYIFAQFPKEVESMINNIEKIDGYLKDIGKDPNKPENKLNSEYTKDGTLILKDKNNNIIGIVPKGFEAIQGKKGELIFVNKNADKTSTLQIGEFSLTNVGKNAEIKLTETKDAKTIFIDKGSTDLNIAGNFYKNIKGGIINPAEFKIRTYIVQNKKITEIEYANFYAGEAEKYDFNYKGKTYSLTAPDINSNIIFDPLNKKLSATSGTVQQATLKLTEKGLECQKCASINIGDYSLSCTGSCEITLDDKFDLNAAEVRGKGLFLDNKNKIKANGEKFLVCLSGHPIEQFDKVKGCEREGIQNAFWLNKDEKINTNAIKTKGELDYSVGFTGVHANKDSETKFLQRPDLVNDFSITKGKAIVSKDSIKTIVEYKSCQKTTGSAILGFFLLYEESKKTCGTSIKLERIGVPLTVTEDLFIKPSEGGKIYNINPLGNVIGASVKQNQKGEIEVVNTIFGEYDPQSSLVKEHIKAFYGRNFASKAGTSILSSDTIIAELSDLNKKLDPSYLDKLTPTLKEGRIISMYGNKEEAVKGITTRLNKVKRFQKLVEEGYPVEDALEATGLNKENVGLVFKDLINADGTFNYNNVASTVDKIKNSCKKPVIKQLIEVDYNSVACMDDANTIASFYRNKIIAEDYKNIPKSVNKYLTGNPRSDWARLNLALQTMTTLSDKERNDMARTMQLLKDIEAKNLKNSEAKNFIEADTDLQSYIFTEKLFRAPKLLTGDAALGAVLSESVRGAKYLDNIIKTKYFATVEAISEGKAAKSLIKTEDLPEIARACI